MAKSAKDLYKVALANKKKNEKNKPKASQENVKAFKQKCLNAAEKMAEDGLLSTEVMVNPEEYDIIHPVIEGLRRLGYRHCFVETQDAHGGLIEHRLRISLAHLGE